VRGALLGQVYGSLRDSVVPLVALLKDEDEKTRANAAGALGAHWSRCACLQHSGMDQPVFHVVCCALHVVCRMVSVACCLLHVA
jgi:hypothetical protein